MNVQLAPAPNVAPVKQDADIAPKKEVAALSLPSLYKVYQSAEEIQYAPEDALKEGLGMVKALKASIKKVDLGSKMRHDVWQEEIKKCVLEKYVLRGCSADPSRYVQLVGPGCAGYYDCCLWW